MSPSGLKILGIAISLWILAFALPATTPAAAQTPEPPTPTVGNCEIKPQAQCQGADLRRAKLSKADLREADLRATDLAEADLSQADLSGANLGRASLQGGRLTGAKLSTANLRGANLRSSNLQAADLGGANLTEVDLSWANLSGANLKDANLTGSRRCGVIWPDGRRDLEACTKDSAASAGGATPTTQPALVAATTLSTVSGRVVDQFGTPARGAVLFATPQGTISIGATSCPIDAGGRGYSHPVPLDAGPAGLSSYSAYSDGDGAFTFELTPGDWAISATKAGLFSGPEAVYRTHVETTAIADLTLQLLQPTATIVGTVRTATGTAVSGGSVLAGDVSGRYWQSAAIEQDGTYTLPAIVGTWNVSALPASPRTDGLRTGRRGILIGPATQSVTADLALQPAAANLGGRLADDQGQLIASAVVSGEWHSPAGDGLYATSLALVDATGAYTLPVAAGQWSLLGVSLESITETLPVLTSAVVEPDAAPPAKDLSLPAATHCLRGRILDFAGDPAMSAVLAASMSPAGAPNDTILSFGGADGQGVYEAPLVAGAWNLLVRDVAYDQVPSISDRLTVPDDLAGRDYQLRAPFALLAPTLVREARVAW